MAIKPADAMTNHCLMMGPCFDGSEIAFTQQGRQNHRSPYFHAASRKCSRFSNGVLGDVLQLEANRSRRLSPSETKSRRTWASMRLGASGPVHSCSWAVM